MRPYYYPAYWYNPYIPMVKYADTSWWQNVTPYLQAGGIGAGLGALGGAGIGALRGGDWKKALKSALIGMVAGAVAGPAVYAGYSALFPKQTAAPVQRPTIAGMPIPEDTPLIVTRNKALLILRSIPILEAQWNLLGRPQDIGAIQKLFHAANLPYTVVEDDEPSR